MWWSFERCNEGQIDLIINKHDWRDHWTFFIDEAIDNFVKFKHGLLIKKAFDDLENNGILIKKYWEAPDEENPRIQKNGSSRPIIIYFSYVW